MAHNRLMQTLLNAQNNFVITYHYVYVGSFMGEKTLKILKSLLYISNSRVNLNKLHGKKLLLFKITFAGRHLRMYI